MTLPEGYRIELTRGYVCVVDEEDAPAVLAAGPWFAVPRHGHVYAERNGAPQLLHALLGDGRLVDHADGCGLNNTRGNLRPATVGLNQANKQVSRSSRSGFKGVASSRHHWRARITVNGQTRTFNGFPSAEEAARAYDSAARAAWGAFACLNFPGPGERSALIPPPYESYRILPVPARRTRRDR